VHDVETTTDAIEITDQLVEFVASPDCVRGNDPDTALTAQSIEFEEILGKSGTIALTDDHAFQRHSNSARVVAERWTGAVIDV
jgi:hypothetical protein